MLAHDISKSHQKALTPESWASESSYSKHLKKAPSQSLPVYPAAGYCPPSQLTKRRRNLLLHPSEAAASSQARLPRVELSGGVPVLLSPGKEHPPSPKAPS